MSFKGKVKKFNVESEKSTELICLRLEKATWDWLVVNRESINKFEAKVFWNKAIPGNYKYQRVYHVHLHAIKALTRLQKVVETLLCIEITYNVQSRDCTFEIIVSNDLNILKIHI